MRALSNSAIGSFVAKDVPESDLYAERTAAPVMEAIDAMPAEYRALVNEFGYIDVYRAWRRGMSPAHIRSYAEATGFFQL